MTFRERLDAIVKRKVEEARTARLVAAFAGCATAVADRSGPDRGAKQRSGEAAKEQPGAEGPGKDGR